MKKIFLIIAVATVYLISFKVAVNASSSPYDVPDFSRDYYYGYFTDDIDTDGDYVLQNDANDPSRSAHVNSSGGYDAIKPATNTADEFINEILSRLNSSRVDSGTSNSAKNWDRTGAAFIIQTMIGAARNRPPTAAQIAEWEARVRHAASIPGHINWNWSGSTGAPNTYYMIHRNDGSSTVNDVGFYNGSRSGTAIRFYKDNGALAYTLYRQCANPLGQIDPLSPATWAATGTTTVTDDDGAAPGDTPTEISVRPGAQLSFNHTITNSGPSTSGTINYSINARETNPSNPWTGQYYSNATLSGSPTFTRQDTNIAFNWGTGGPGGGLPVDNFSVRWTKTENLPAGTYWFTAVADDGVRVYIDGVLRIDAWVAQAATSYNYTASLAAGNHTIQMEYYEGGGAGYSRFDYTNFQTVGYQSSGTYTSGQTKALNSPEIVNVPSNATAGSQYCRRVFWSPKDSDGTGDSGAGGGSFAYQACATVTGSYTLVPAIVPSSTVASQGDTVTFTYNVTNTGSIDATNIACSIAGTQPSGTPAPPATNCPRTIPDGPTATQVTNSVESITITSQPAGSQICRTLTVNPGSSGGGAVSSPQVCITVAKKPYVHFKGGDVWAGGGFIKADGTCTTNTGAKITTVSNSGSSAGSVSEYGTFALGDVTKFGSGNKALFDSSNFADLGRRLVFSNNNTNLGRFGAPQHCMSGYVANYQSATSSGATTVDVGSTCNGSWHITGDVQMYGLMAAGCKQVYLVDGDVTITGGPQYVDPGGNPTYSSASQIPSLVVIAAGTMSPTGVVTKGNIFVPVGVSQMDGVYVARNTFYTCYPKLTPISTSVCNNRLTVNGSVIAGTIDLYRTFGGDGPTLGQRQAPAEIFNLSPEVFLNNALSSSVSQSVSTADSRELPPRF